MRDEPEPTPTAPFSANADSPLARLGRREILKLGMAATAGAGMGLLGPAPGHAQAPAPAEGTVWHMSVDIPGAPEASRNIREIAIDDLEIDARIVEAGRDPEYRLYGPGHAHWGSARFTSAVTLGASKELRIWFNEAAKGKNIRKNITVTLFKSDKTPGRSYTLMDCFPTQWSSVSFDTSSNVQSETLTVKVMRIEFKV